MRKIPTTSVIAPTSEPTVVAMSRASEPSAAAPKPVTAESQRKLSAEMKSFWLVAILAW